ncbi:MAG: anaerobic ribonucleoside-triphosphate reductase activating protein [Firmicutes bacterium]|nr:anaerobic ribonucleoside-triphosphate reductase activating protein [Bacillota bacterium]
MKIGGITPLSLIDYPGRPAVVLFTVGCNLRCPYCHNAELVLQTGEEQLTEKEVFTHLASRVGLLDSLCITGGEPTIHTDLVEFIAEIKAMGLDVKLDTNGSKPKVLKELLSKELLDYVALDIKSSPERYREATGGRLDFEEVARTATLLKEAGVSYELRTTCVPGIVEIEDIAAVADMLGGVKRYVLQQFRATKTLDAAYTKVNPHPPVWFEKAKHLLLDSAEEIATRGI